MVGCASLFSARARLMVRGRRGQNFRDEGTGTGLGAGAGKRETIMVHCASLGEFEQGRPLVEALRAQYPEARLVVTFFSPSGYEIRKNYAGADAVYYLPLDTPRAARRFVAQLQPDRVFFVKYEFWRNILRALHRSGARVYLVSGIFRKDMTFFRSAWAGGNFFRSILGSFDHFFVQDEASAALLASIGLGDRVTVAGDTRFDRVAGLAQSAPRNEAVERFVGDSFTVVAGSTWPEDEALLIELMAARPDWKFVVAPHEISSERIDRFMADSGRKAIRYSNISAAQGDETLLMIDSIGLLSSLYRYGQLAYIGGGFGAGIHNTLEAAAWGRAVVFGPRYTKFREAVGLVECGAAISVTTADELKDAMATLSSSWRTVGDLAAAYVQSHIGATSTIMDYELTSR